MKIYSISEAFGAGRLAKLLKETENVIIGAGSGLSTAAGYTYSGERFDRYFPDFRDKYHIWDIYSGGFYPFESQELFWGWWCRYIWINRYEPIPNDAYDLLYQLVKDKDYFVLTTNVDHCFQRARFDRKRLFYTQGDYGLFQSADPHGVTAHRTYDNKEIVREMLLSEGFTFDGEDHLLWPKDGKVSMEIDSSLIPVCPDDGEAVTMNLRQDDKFVQDEGWHVAADRYQDFLKKRLHEKILYLELGVGMNTPGIIKYPFWRLTYDNPKASYVTINMDETCVPEEIGENPSSLREIYGKC